MPKKNTLNQIRAAYPKLKKIKIPAINKEVFNYLQFFIDNKDILVAALIQNPYGKNSNITQIQKDFSPKIKEILQKLNRLYEPNEKTEVSFKNNKEIFILFLANYYIWFKQRKKNPSLKKMITQRRVRFAMKILIQMDITEIRNHLEDVFFSYLEPEIYQHYASLLKFTRKKYLFQQKKIIKTFQEMMIKNGIEASIQARVKTIYSIHNKIKKKNILFSQVLDTIGLRIILKNEEACYQAMVSIIKTCPIMTTRIKDYIAIPKENGYQSIHLTILHQGHPVEIQIRTRQMHRQAQYGIAAHHYYKSLQ